MTDRHMASGGSAAPSQSPENVFNLAGCQHVNCLINFYGPIAVHLSSTARQCPQAGVERSTASEADVSRESSASHTSSDVASIGLARVEAKYKLCGTRQAVIAWLIAQLQRLRERVSRREQVEQVTGEERTCMQVATYA